VSYASTKSSEFEKIWGLRKFGVPKKCEFVGAQSAPYKILLFLPFDFYFLPFDFSALHSSVLGNHIVRKALHRRGDIAVA
jgi:hypothetical protein